MVNNLSGFINFRGKTQATSGANNQVRTQSFGEKTQAQEKQACSTETVKAYQTTGIKTTLSTDTAKQQYSVVSSMLEPEARVALSGLLKTGILLNNNSNDGSSVLENLHKIATEPRIKGLSAKNLLTEAITTVKINIVFLRLVIIFQN